MSVKTSAMFLFHGSSSVVLILFGIQDNLIQSIQDYHML